MSKSLKGWFWIAALIVVGSVQALFMWQGAQSPRVLDAFRQPVSLLDFCLGFLTAVVLFGLLATLELRRFNKNLKKEDGQPIRLPFSSKIVSLEDFKRRRDSQPRS